MDINLLLALCVLVLTVGLVSVTLRTVRHLQSENRKYKFLYETVKDETNEWEKRTLAYSVELQEERTRFEDKVQQRVQREIRELQNQMNVKLAPESHNVQQTDVEGLILSSPDPLWQFVAEHRDLLHMWEQRRLDIVDTQPHYRYSEYATWLANFCEGHFNYDDVKRAIEAMEVVR